MIRKPAKKLEGRQELLLLPHGELLQNGSSEPILPCGAILSKQPLAFTAEGHQRLASIIRVRRAVYQARILQRGDDGTHRLRAHSLCTSQA